LTRDRRKLRGADHVFPRPNRQQARVVDELDQFFQLDHLYDVLVVVGPFVLAIFAFALAHRWWRENEWKRHRRADRNSPSRNA
jgi:hypothetical protein